FYVGMIAPVEVVVDGPSSDVDVEAGIDELVTQIEGHEQFGPATVETNEAGDLTLVSAPLVSDTNSEASYAAVNWLRETVVPATFNGAGAEVYVTGETALNEDFNTMLDDYMPIVFVFVLGLSFILLMLAFRSIVVPISAIIMNLLSVGAAYGLLVLMFQKGYGDFLGFQRTPTIEAWVPIFLFCILFGLSMDYHVFLLSRIREHFDSSHNNRESVAVGLQSTGKIITGAALIMVAVFAGFASGSLVMMQQVGFGLAVAVFLDATIVRSVLVPASMALLGNLNWYLPRWLHWLPDLRVEGAASHVQPAPAPVAAGGGDD
ncbi:MAG: MMPL family transporter, partial [Vicinamibacterales bacterium]